MDEYKPTNSPDYIPGLKKVRSRRLFLWLVIIVYLPAMMLALDSPDYKTWVAVVFVTWLVLLIVAVAFACLVRCPRCGNCFHTHGPTFLPFRRCLHCSLHVNADKRAPEEHSPQARFPDQETDD
ncbi:MAG: hypothetical protein C0622_13740 [Desulfuromonas sp.]|nr:MAG: hypothetical protein C0622_13740 [Desulfuromonas sp.]